MILKYISWRYVKSKSSQNVINIINRMTTFVLVVGGASLMIVLAGFAGLKTFSLSFSNFFDPDLKILPSQGKFINFSQEIQKKINSVEGILVYSQVLEERVFLSSNQKNHIAYIKGVDSLYQKVNQMDSILSVNPSEFRLSPELVVVGNSIANILNLGLYSAQTPLQIIVPKQGTSISGASAYREKVVLVSDYYRVTEDLDQKYVFADIALARELLGVLENEISSVEIKIKPNFTEEEVALNLKKVLGEDFLVKNRLELNSDLHKMFNTENLATYLIFTLVLIVALFNLVGAIIMTILDKRQNLKTLYALGLEVKDLRKIFFLQGFWVTCIGAILGVLLGLLIVFLQIEFKLLLINPNALNPIAYPMEVRLTDIGIVFFTILILGTLASLIGSIRLKKEDIF